MASSRSNYNWIFYIHVFKVPVIEFLKLYMTIKQLHVENREHKDPDIECKKARIVSETYSGMLEGPMSVCFI